MPKDTETHRHAIKDLRQKIVAEAQTWIGTPYHHMGRQKGSGVDCLFFLVEVYAAVGALSKFDLKELLSELTYYAPDWHLHRDEERYLEGLLKYGVRVPIPMPGDIVTFQTGRTVSHAGIWIGGDEFIHSWNRGTRQGVLRETMNEYWWQRYTGAFRPKSMVEMEEHHG
jgi:cell wall-associated NlpC family hydrolase